MWLLKSPLDQNSRVIYQKFNGDFKSHINFGGTKGGQENDVYHYSTFYDLYAMFQGIHADYRVHVCLCRMSVA